jgi:hypothetical protein
MHVFVLSLLASFWALATLAQNAASQYDSEDVSVLSAVLVRSCQHPGKDILLETDTPAIEWLRDNAAKNVHEPYNETLPNLFERNAVSHAVPAALCVAIRRMAQQQIVAQLNNEWHGSGFALSLPGYNPGRTLAVVYLAQNCGLRCGGGSWIELRKRNGTWEGPGVPKLARIPSAGPRMGCREDLASNRS